MPSPATRDAQDGSDTFNRLGGNPTDESGALLTKWTMPIVSADRHAHSLHGSNATHSLMPILYPVFRLSRRKLLFAETILNSLLCTQNLPIRYTTGQHFKLWTQCNRFLSDCKRERKAKKQRGLGTFSMEFAKYKKVPNSIQEAIVKERKEKK